MFCCFGNFKSKYLSLSKAILNAVFLHEAKLFPTADEGRRVVNVLSKYLTFLCFLKDFSKGNYEREPFFPPDFERIVGNKLG